MRADEVIPYRTKPAKSGVPPRLKRIQIEAALSRAMTPRAGPLLPAGMILGRINSEGRPPRRGKEAA
jgi:hypothetical protein